MSLADLPIENIALIQSYYSSMKYFSTRLFNTCRSIRKKALQHVWPELFVSAFTHRLVECLQRYNFAGVCVCNKPETAAIIRTIFRDIKVVELTRDTPLHHYYYGKRTVVYYHKAMHFGTPSYTNTELHTHIVVFVNSRTININSNVPYELTIVSDLTHTSANVKLYGVIPIKTTIDNNNGTPYAHSNTSCNIRLYILHDDKIINRVDVQAGKCITLNDDTIYNSKPIHIQSKCLLHDVVKEPYVKEVLRRDTYLCHDDIDAFADHVVNHHHHEEHCVSKNVDIEAVLETLRSGIINDINKRFDMMYEKIKRMNG